MGVILGRFWVSPAEAGYDRPFDDFIQNNPFGKQLYELMEKWNATNYPYNSRSAD